MSRRRLDNLWTAFLTAQTSESMSNTQKDETLKFFLQDFLQMEQIAREEAQDEAKRQNDEAADEKVKASMWNAFFAKPAKKKTNGAQEEDNFDFFP